MQDLFYKMIFFGGVNAVLFGSVYLYGRNAFPKRAFWLTMGSWMGVVVVSYFRGAFSLALSIILVIVFLRVLRKPSNKAALQQFYRDNKIYCNTKKSQAVLDILGDKNWSFAQGTITAGTKSIPYFFWQGYTMGSVAVSQYSHMTTFTHYLVFVFPPGSITPFFKQAAVAAADKSNYTFRQRLKFFFVQDTDKPCLVTTAADGCLVIQYITPPDAAQYQKRLNWIKENLGKTYLSISQTTSSYN